MTNSVEKKVTACDNSCDPGNGIPNHSVCVMTDAGPVYIGEFRTWGEAVALANSAARHMKLHVSIRREGTEVCLVDPAVAKAAASAS
jgi:hypothetical protein